MIPPELLSFLEMDSRTLLLKGPAGSGKTLLAVELAKGFQLMAGDVFWVTSRHSDPSEALDLEALLPEKRRKDVTAPSPSAPGKEQSPPDAPVGTAKPASILLDLEQDLEGPRTLVIFDSIDGLWDVPQAKEVSAFINNTKAMAERTGVRVLFIAESAGPHVADHLVDGVVRLQQEHVGGSLVRTCTLQKMRGTALGHPVYVFTLADGKFSTHVEPQDTPAGKPLRPSGRSGPDDRLSTGNLKWDLLLEGGLLPGSVHLVGYSQPAVADLKRITVPLILNALALRRPVVFVGLPNERPEQLKGLVYDHSDPSVTGLLRVMEPSRLMTGPVPEPGPVFEHERLAPLDRMRDSLAKEAPPVSVLNLSGLSLHGDPKGIRSWLGAWCQKTRALGGVDLWLTSTESAGLYSLLSDDWWELDRLLDTPVLRGKIPRTENHILHWRTHKGYPEGALEPIH
jgi:KaiC/GvpD/RAD55 family RecA-like ATPase